jgi:hypothetical protein
MKLKEILDTLDDYCDGTEDLYNKEIHELTDDEAEHLTVKEFLLNLLMEYQEDLKE